MYDKHKKFALIVSLIGIIMLVSSFTSSVNAQGWNNRNCMGGMNRDDGWKWNNDVPQKYQLSADQKKSIGDIRSAYGDQIVPLQKELGTLRIEANGYASRSDAEIGKIKSYRKDIHNLDDKIADLRLEAKAEINKVLTKEQRAYFDDNFVWGDMAGNMMNNMDCNMARHCPMMSESNY